MSIDRKDPQLLVFVSFSMPAKSLQAWSDQVNKVKGDLVFRGLYKNSIRSTIEQTKMVFGEKQTASMKIDPELFKNFILQKCRQS